jgi:hypothetical protein
MMNEEVMGRIKVYYKQNSTLKLLSEARCHYGGTVKGSIDEITARLSAEFDSF